jgi:hypothetical protein
MLKNAEDKHKPGERCDLCGGDLMIVNAVSDDFGSFSICAGCAELWTTYLMHHPRLGRQFHADPPYPRTEFETD